MNLERELSSKSAAPLRFTKLYSCLVLLQQAVVFVKLKQASEGVGRDQKQKTTCFHCLQLATKVIYCIIFGNIFQINTTI